uniref:Nudix hydrolase domain-containing protein n=1 Tax=Parascaris univalens TaxID=6257 RepID=A0A914ZUD7_PARUN
FSLLALLILLLVELIPAFDSRSSKKQRKYSTVCVRQTECPRNRLRARNPLVRRSFLMYQLRSALLDKHHHQGRHRHVYPMSTSCALSRASRVNSTLSVAQHRIAHNGRRSAQNQNSY